MSSTVGQQKKTEKREDQYIAGFYLSEQNRPYAAEGRKILKVVMFSTESKKKIFHLSGCPYSKRIRYRNRMTTGIAEAEKSGYQACRYCCTMRGFYNINKSRLEAQAERDGFCFTFVSRTGTLYVCTDVSAWKIFMMPNLYYRLCHLNEFLPSMTGEQIIYGKYHIQTDVRPAWSPFALIDYIIKHDKAKRIIEEDYRKLPKKTKREKRYYKMAERKSMLKNKRRVSELLDCISCGGMPASKWVTIR